MKLQTLKKFAGAVLSLALLGATLAGCGDNNGSGTSSGGVSSAGSSSPESSAVSSGGESAASSAETGADAYDYSEGLDDNGFFAGVKALDYVKLPDYKSIEVPAETLEISDEDVNVKADAVFSARNQPAQITDQEVKDGDTVNIDYVGSVDGVEFQGGSTNGQGTDVTIGTTQYIDDFLEQLIGHRPGETVEVNVTFPEDYGKEDLNGKDALFITEINYIQGEAKYTELTDDFVAAELKDEYGWSNVAEMKAGLKERLQQAAAGEYVWQKIQEQAEVSEVPQAVADYHMGNMKNYYATMAEQNGMTMEDYLKQNEIATEEELVEKNQEAMDSNAKSSLILQALCEELNVTAGDEEVEDYFRYELNDVGDHSKYTDFYGTSYLRMMVREYLVKLELGK